MKINGQHYRTVWMEGNTVKLIDQPKIPHITGVPIHDCPDYKATAEAISTMVVRGAGAIGATGAYGVAQAVLESTPDNYEDYLRDAVDILRGTRPTAQNLFTGIDFVLDSIKDLPYKMAISTAVRRALEFADYDAESCEKIGEYGNELIDDGFNILTHCNAGWLAFVDWGSALSPIFKANRGGKKIHVYVDETRPRCQGARLTAWELGHEGVPHTVIPDNAAAKIMSEGSVDMVIVGSDRIAANGDVANKIGTYDRAIIAKEFGIPFYVAAPTTTIDRDTPSGRDIPIA